MDCQAAGGSWHVRVCFQVAWRWPVRVVAVPGTGAESGVENGHAAQFDQPLPKLRYRLAGAAIEVKQGQLDLFVPVGNFGRRIEKSAPQIGRPAYQPQQAI
jgi:hypothetical protein